MTASLLKRTLSLIALATFAAFLWQYTKRGTPKALPKGIKLPKEIAEDITIFHRPNCIYCLRAKYFFDERSLPYEEINLNENKEAYEELTKTYEESDCASNFHWRLPRGRLFRPY